MKCLGWMLLAVILLGWEPPRANAGGFFLTRWFKSKLEKPVARSFSPANVYRSKESLPADMRRVAILPLTPGTPNADSDSVLESNGEILARELGKAYAFEVVRISPEKLRRWSGRSQWKADEPFPLELLGKLREHYSCQAVLFAEMTHFQPYGPVSVGWRLKLIEARRGEIVWATDEVFDSGVPEVATAAKRFAQNSQNEAYPTDSGDPLILNSPRRFAQYSLHSLFATLPRR
jgi:hypothetical protein